MKPWFSTVPVTLAELQSKLEAAHDADPEGPVIIRGDSELIVKQMRGEYRVRNADLKELHDEAQTLLYEFEDSKFEHNLRHKNKLADKLANLAMDRKAEVIEVDESPLDVPAAVATEAGDRFECGKCGCAIQVKTPSKVRPHQLRPFVCQCGNRMDRPE